MKLDKYCYSFVFGVVIVIMATIISYDDGSVNATSTSEKIALIAYSNLTSIDHNEVDKINSLYDSLIVNGYDDEDIYIYGPNVVKNNKGIANISNIESGLKQIVNNNNLKKEILIYISDHGQPDNLQYNLLFTDGIMNSDLINSYIYNMTYSELTIIFCGNHSGGAGTYFSDTDIDIICSMDESENYSPDEFNIARSLNDPLADQDSNGIITYIEAAQREIDVLATYTQQTPRIWEG